MRTSARLASALCLAPLLITSAAVASDHCSGGYTPPPTPPPNTPTPDTYRGPADTGGGGGRGGGHGAPGSPSAPAPASPLPGRGVPRPATPPSSPLAPGILPNPYTIGGEAVSDPSAWQLWWEFHRDLYLHLPDIDTRRVASDGGDFFLGVGQRELPVPGGRADRKLVADEIIPALAEITTKGGDLALLRDAMIAQAKAGRRVPEAGFWGSLRFFLENNPDLEVKRVAAVSLGILRDKERLELLGEIARDTAAARSFVGQDEIDPALRANAIYGIALAGEAATRPIDRRAAVADLMTVVEGATTPHDLRAAALLAVGRVPLRPVEGHLTCTCGHCEIAEPSASFQDQLSWVINRFLDPREDTAVRAQAVTTMARLMSHRPTAIEAQLEAHVVDLLIDSLDEQSQQPNAVRRGAVLGLSMLGDADDDVLDRWIRWALTRSMRKGERLERRWASIGLGLVGSRPGESGDLAFVESHEARDALLHQLAKGRRSERAWAALGLGVLGHWLRANEQELDADTDRALRAAVRNRRRADDAGAFALAVGLRRDLDATEELLRELDGTRDPVAKGHVALALGLVGDKAALEPLRELLVTRKAPAALRSRVGLALGLLADPDVVPELLVLLEDEDQDIRTGAIQALGFLGDERSAKALGEVLNEDVTPLALRQEAARALGRMADDSPLPWRSALAVGADYVSCPTSLTNPGRTGALDLE